MNKKGQRKRLSKVHIPSTNSCQSWQKPAASGCGWIREFIFAQSLFGQYFRICQEGWQLVPIMIHDMDTCSKILDLYYWMTLHLYLKTLCKTLQPSVTRKIGHVNIETIFLHHKKTTLCSLQTEVLLGFLRRYKQTTTRKTKYFVQYGYNYFIPQKQRIKNRVN